VTDQALAALLASKQILPAKRLAEAIQQAKAFSQSLVATLVDRGFISKRNLGRTIAAAYGVDAFTSKRAEIAPKLQTLIPEETAAKYKLLPVKQTGNTLIVAMADPSDFEAINFIQKRTSLRIEPLFIFEDDLYRALGVYKRDIQAVFQDLLASGLGGDTGSDLTKIAQDIPVVQALNTMLEFAIAQRASDVHFEGEEQEFLIRFRVDGILRDVLRLPKQAQAALVARIKILSNLKIDEHRLPQDGRFRYDSLGQQIALRVSVIPSFYGENVVLRLLFESERPRTLRELGFSKEQEVVVVAASQKTHGLLLVTGPTGSGKTTTLYSILHLLNEPSVKICTVEDPIEYGIPRLSQIQVNPLTGLDFATGLRSLLRHDPDVIMVGEIRDSETANTAIHAALTGHLVLSTLHTNDAPTAIPRFLDLGSEAFLLGSTLNLVIAQRLVRMLCHECQRPSKPPAAILTEIAAISGESVRSLKRTTFSGAKGCSACHGSGYQGRIGIYELFEVTERINPLILEKAPIEQIRQAAERDGMVTMFADGLAKAKAGLTTLEELLRVSRE
jgi:type IV pilus assembly protein PilB